MKEITIGILAHVDAGKTTCIESMLYHSGVIRRMGRVDTKDAAMDTDPQERSHGITIYAKEARITWKDTTINLIDTPGHVDFSQEMERALSVIDLAVVLISGLDGTQAHTETIMSLLAHYLGRGVAHFPVTYQSLIGINLQKRASLWGAVDIGEAHVRNLET